MKPVTVALNAERSSVEFSGQSIPRTSDYSGVTAPSVPLHGLAKKAPRLWRRRPDPNYLTNAFSNDESASSFEQTQARTSLAEYRIASNRVAVLVGESALAAAVQYIPEETVIMLDQSKNICLYMRNYIAALKGAHSIDDWKDRAGLTKGSIKPQVRGYYDRRLDAQVEEWERNGYPHPLTSEDEFKKAQEAAQSKAIIPWRADIADARDMQKLAHTLQAADATVTMMNLSNVAVCDARFSDASDLADSLGVLPITPHAPILTTASAPKVYGGIEGFMASLTGQAIDIFPATGPWFGLENMAIHGGPTQGDDLGAIALPQLISSAGAI